MLTQLVREQPHQTAPFADHVSIPGMNKLIFRKYRGQQAAGQDPGQAIYLGFGFTEFGAVH